MSIQSQHRKYVSGRELVPGQTVTEVMDGNSRHLFEATVRRTDEAEVVLDVFGKEQAYPCSAKFEVEMSDDEFRARHKKQAKKVMKALCNRMAVYEIGSHEMWNAWLSNDPYEMAAYCESEKMEILGFCSDIIPKTAMFSGDVLDIGICAETEQGEKFWCHYRSDDIKTMFQRFSDIAPKNNPWVEKYVSMDEKEELKWMRHKDDQQRVLSFIKPGSKVLVVGGDAAIVKLLLDKEDIPLVHVIDTDEKAIEELLNLTEPYHSRAYVEKTPLWYFSDSHRFDAVIFASSLHRIFSHTVMQEQKFNVGTIDKALKKAAGMLSAGGRIIVRDGVKPISNRRIMLQYKDPETKVLAERFEKMFQGFPLNIVHTQYGEVMPNRAAAELIGAIVRGKDAFDTSVQEWVGFFNEKEWEKQEQRLMAKSFVSMIHYEEYTIPEYRKQAEEKVSLLSAPRFTKSGDVSFKATTFPNTTCLVVFEKMF